MGTNPTSTHIVSARMSRVSTADKAASEPTTTTRSGSLIGWGAYWGVPKWATSGWAAISAKLGVGSSGNTSAASESRAFNSWRVGTALTSISCVDEGTAISVPQRSTTNRITGRTEYRGTSYPATQRNSWR